MKPELKVKWVAALRSGTIKQTEETLRDESGAMCCIGVLGQILGIEDDTLFRKGAYLGSAEHCSRGLGALDNCGLSMDTRNKLANMNDGKNGEVKHSFHEIADCIEANIPADVAVV